MKFQYTSYQPPLYNLKITKRPEIPIEVFFGDKSIRTTAVIDTGADYTLLHLQYAEALGLDFKDAIELPLVGISGTKNISFLFPQLDLLVVGINTKIRIPIAFIDSDSVNALLGQCGFFDYHKVIFEKYHNAFEVKSR